MSLPKTSSTPGRTVAGRALAGLATAATVAGGWLAVGSLYTKAVAAPLRLEPVAHARYDPALIDGNIAFHEGRVVRDPQGAIGWQLLSGAYLARSRESDSDKFAWKAEDAARKSLSLRVRRNSAAWMKLIQSLLEQHRFQDALRETDKGIAAFPDDVPLRRERADILVEIGKLDEAKATLARLPLTNEGAESAPISARIAAIRGDHPRAIGLYRHAMEIVSKNAATPQAGIAWYLTKIGTEQEAMGDDAAAKRSYDDSLRLFPRSYKAWLGEARIATRKKDWPAVLDACAKTLEVAYSLDAVAMRGDAHKAMGDTAAATKDYAEVKTMYENEVKLTFDGLKEGGPLHVKPIDRQFATFSATHHMYEAEALPAARRDHAKPSRTTSREKNIKVLEPLSSRPFPLEAARACSTSQACRRRILLPVSYPPEGIRNER